MAAKELFDLADRLKREWLKRASQKHGATGAKAADSLANFVSLANQTRCQHSMANLPSEVRVRVFNATRERLTKVMNRMLAYPHNLEVKQTLCRLSENWADTDFIGASYLWSNV